MWLTVLWIVAAVVVFWLWFFFGGRGRCPSCGLELSDDTLTSTRDYRFHTLDHCRHCGWRRR